MKALILAAALAALSSAALAGAARDAHTPTVMDTATATLISDAGRLGSSLTSFNGARWSPAAPRAEVEEQRPAPAGIDIDNGALIIGLGLGAWLLFRPLSRMLRRQAQQRRATALASTLGHTPR